MRDWLASKIIGTRTRPPGGELGMRVLEPDESSLVCIAEGDGFNIVHGDDARGYVVIPVTPRAMLKLAWFALWTWWVRGTWCGWKTSAWQWATEVQLEQQIARQAHGSKQRKAPQARRLR